ncbi:hypothetical protein M1563_02680 [Patescibacteria group bacterium]|nr:hypothetical protein [Patescibacteria group bacterium]MCL5409940.1 hypothetical protein [Patescibacteria group bacterium]
MIKNYLKLNQTGQVVVILLLVMVVILAIALSIISRSTTEISNSTKAENSSRAFAAAEAGLEKALQESVGAGVSSNTFTTNFGNTALANVKWQVDIPVTGTALAVPPLNKDEVAQFWLVDPTTSDLNCGYMATDGKPMLCKSNLLTLYFGDLQDYSSNLEQQPGLELTMAFRDTTGGYYVVRKYYDSYCKNDPTCAAARTNTTGFSGCNVWGSSVAPIPVNDGTTTEQFYCQVNLNMSQAAGIKHNDADTPLMIRARMLFSTAYSQPVGIEPPSGYSIPLQAHIFKSEGVSGDSKRVLQIFQDKDVLPPFMDYVLFSNGDLTK